MTPEQRERKNARGRERRREARERAWSRGQTLDGRPLNRRSLSGGGVLRDHVAEVEEGLALGLGLDGIASDMGITPKSLVTTLRRKGHVDLVRRLGVLSIPDAARARG